MERWNRCDVCGKFIAIADFDKGAVRNMVTPDTAFSGETYETYCIACAPLHTEPFKQEGAR